MPARWVVKSITRHKASCTMRKKLIQKSIEIPTRSFATSSHLFVRKVTRASPRHGRSLGQELNISPEPQNVPSTSSLETGLKKEINPEVTTNGQEEQEARRGKPSLSPLKFIPSHILEHWLDIPAPTLLQRKNANKFFERAPPKLLFTAGSLHEVQYTDVPEVAFLGRSNVGKSTLLNALLGHDVAHVSAKPGRTQTLNAWAAGGPDRTGKRWRMTVLDMPGYGEGSRAEWGTLIQKYLAQRKELRRAFVLVNAHHGLLDTDRMMLEMLRQASIPHQILLSKADRIFNSKSGQKARPKQVQGILKPGNLARISATVDELVESIRAETKGDRRNRELPATPDMIFCSGISAGLPSQKPEGRNTLGITAVRWSILNALGLTGQVVRDENNMTYVT